MTEVRPGAPRSRGARILVLIALLAATVSVTGGLPASAQTPAAQAPSGLTEVSFPDADSSALSPEAADAGVKPEETKRQRFAHFDGTSTTKTLRAAGDQPVTFRLFDDVAVEGTSARVEESADSYYWHGEVVTKGQTVGWIDYTEAAGTSSMSVALVDGREFALAPTGTDDIARVVELDTTAIRKNIVEDDAIPAPPADKLAGDAAIPRTQVPDSSAAPESQPEPSAASVGSASTIDVLVVYTALARSQAGGTSQVQNQIQAAVNSANTALANSGAIPRLRLVRSYETTTYNTKETMVTSIDRLVALSDGPLDEVYGERNAAGADIVTLRSDFTDACGYGYVLGPAYFNGAVNDFEFNPFAVNVVDNSASCNGNWNTLAHEMGHNMGAQHDRANVSPADPLPAFSYSYGYRRLNTFIDVMSYPNNCGNCPRIPYFSTPNRMYNGFPVGTATDDAVRTFNNTSLAASEWRVSGADIVGIARQTTGSGYWTVSSSGIVRGFNGAPFLGDLNGLALDKPIVGIAADQDGYGYYLVGADGGIFSFQATFYGSTGGITLSKPVVGIAADQDGAGYYLVASDGGIFAFQATFYGSTGGIPLNKPVVSMAADPDGIGYWLVASDGGIFAYQAQFQGSLGGVLLDAPIIGMAAPSTNGYWLLGEDGGVFSINVPFYGSGVGYRPMTSMAATLGGTGYLLARRNGNYGSGSVLVKP